MSDFQFFIEEELGDDQIESLLANVFEGHRPTKLADIDEGCLISYDCVRYKGDFKTSIELYAKPELLNENFPKTDFELAQLISSTYDIKVLISDDNINPLTWILVDDDRTFSVTQKNLGEGFMSIDYHV